MPPELLYGRVLPGAAVSLVVGNVFYAWQARRLAARTGRRDVCALPYGINTVSLFGHVFLIMLPAKLAAEAAGAADPARVAWQAGLVARSAPGLIELALALVAERGPPRDAARGAALDARRHRPRLHLARLPLPDVRTPDRRPHHARRSSC